MQSMPQQDVSLFFRHLNTLKAPLPLTIQVDKGCVWQNGLKPHSLALSCPHLFYPYSMSKECGQERHCLHHVVRR